MTMSTPLPPTEDLLQDGLLLKTILQEGDGNSPGRGARVSVRYKLRLSEDLNEAPFDSSAKRKDGILSFTLGRKKVIPALELVAQSMKVGEKSVTKCAAPYAFGSKGLKRKGVPGGANVYLEVEMVEIAGEDRKNLADMSPRERFSEAKECKERGNTLFKEQKFDKALQMYSQCIRLLTNVFYRPDAVREKKLNGKPDDTGFEEAKVEETYVEEAQIEEVKLEEDANQHTNGTLETAQADDQANGGQEEQHNGKVITEEKPAKDETVTDENNDGEEVQTIDVTTGVSKEMDMPQSKAEAETETEAKEAAVSTTNGEVNEAKKEDQPNGTGEEEAQKSDSKIEEASTPPANGEGLSEDPEEQEVRALHVTTLNNLSLCFVKLENYKEAVESASLALKIDPGSSKALYYRGRAKIALGEWDMARSDLVAAAKIQPNNPGIRNEIIKLDRKVKQFEQREKKQAAAMFA